MNLQIILLMGVFLCIRSWEIKSLKRIKRTDSLKNHSVSTKQDFVMPLNEEQKSLEISNRNDSKLKWSSFIFKPAMIHDTVLSSNIKRNTSTNIPTDGNKAHNISGPLIIKSNEEERQRQDRDVFEKITDNMNLKKLKYNKHIDTSENKHVEVKGKFKKPFKFHKTKHSPQVLHSTSIVETKVVLPARLKQTVYSGLNPFDAMEQLVNLGNTMYRIGMDSWPYNSFQPKLQIANTYEKENFNELNNEPGFGYIFRSIEEPQIINNKKLNTPFFEDENSSLQTHGLVYNPSVSAEEPGQLENLMQNALDTLLASSDGNSNENEIELRCPIHHQKKSVQNVGDEANDIHVCSCQLIKKATKEGIKKLA